MSGRSRASRWVGALCLVALVACGSPGAGGEEPDGVQALGASIERVDARVDEAGVRELTAAQNDFAVDVFRTALAQAEEPNADLVLGPGSLHTALSLIRAGAAGQTATEIDAVLRAGQVSGSLDQAQNALERELRSRDDTRGIELAIANRVWVQQGLELAPDYVRTVSEQYGAALAAVDIATDPEAAREDINAWVSSNTAERIPELFPEGSIASNTRVVLANAVHLDANWRYPFDPAETVDAPFQLLDGSSVDVPTMRYDLYLPSGRGPGYTAVRLPYNGEQLAMTVIVPDDLASFEKDFSAGTLDVVERSIKDGGIHLTLPRFSAGSHLSLAEVLSAMGMPSAFTGAADFSKLTDGGGLQLAAVEHEAVVDVDEKGTKADAASGGAFLGSHGPTVTVDRPFLFVVRDQPTGAVLFLGRVTDPR